MANSVGQELLNTPFDTMVSKLGLAIADSQKALDEASMDTAAMMAQTDVTIPELNDETGDAGFTKVPMLTAGFQPTFYQFTDTIIEVKMAISMNRTKSAGVKASAKAGIGPVSASVTASYSSKYSYSVEGSSLIRTKITPVPPNAFIAKLFEVKTALVQKTKLEELDTAEDALEN